MIGIVLLFLLLLAGSLGALFAIAIAALTACYETLGAAVPRK